MPSVYTLSREQFEQRMRVRRAATCVAVARSAIASGHIAEAIDRLEEACALDPDAAEARLLLEELRSQEAPEPVGTAPRKRSEMMGWSHWVAAAIAICALAALAFFWPNRPASTDGLAEPARDAHPAPAAAPPPAATGLAPDDGITGTGLAAQLSGEAGFDGAVGTGGSGPVHNPAPSRSDTSIGIKVTDEPAAQPALPARTETKPAPARDAESEAAAAAVPSAPASAPPAAPTTVSPSSGDHADAVAAPPASLAPQAASAQNAAMQLPPLERVPVTDDPPVQPTREVPVPTAAPSRPAAVRAEAPVEPAVNEAGRQIESTLQRYADAYARLDAAAARQVWPTVDERALARAFEGLESQGLVFEHCDVTVAGEDATAACSGKARYVPKVGSREPLVARRQWTFRLRKADEGWQITQAHAR